MLTNGNFVVFIVLYLFYDHQGEEKEKKEEKKKEEKKRERITSAYITNHVVWL